MATHIRTPLQPLSISRHLNYHPPTTSLTTSQLNMFAVCRLCLSSSSINAVLTNIFSCLCRTSTLPSTSPAAASLTVVAVNREFLQMLHPFLVSDSVPAADVLRARARAARRSKPFSAANTAGQCQRSWCRM